VLLALVGPASTVAQAAGHVIPIGVHETTPMEFGKFWAGHGPNPGFAVLGCKSPNVNKITSVGGGVTIDDLLAKTAVFRVTGDAGSLFSFKVPASTTVTCGTHAMTVNTFTTDFVAPPAPALTFHGAIDHGVDPAAFHDVKLGAKLIVGVNQFPGRYTGTYSVIVTYE
jgi:hypothetical protein